MNNLARARFILLFCLAILPLAGCAGFLDPGPPNSIYQLNPDLSGITTGERLSFQLAVVKPTSNNLLSTNMMLIRFTSGEVRAWNSISWIASAPNMFQQFLLEAYEDVDMLSVMSHDTLGYKADYRLLSDLRQFTVVLDQNKKPAYVQVELSVHLVNLKAGKSIGSLNSDNKVEIVGTGLEAVLLAYNSATSLCIKEVRDWSIKLLQSE